MATSAASFWKFDEELGWTNVPNATGRIVSTEFDIHVQYNSYGFRDDEFDATDAKKIMMLGDSFIFGNGVNQNERVSEVLENLTDYEVWNMGVSGYGTDQQYLSLKRHGAQFEPDIVMMGFFTNDITNTNGAVQYGMAKPKLEIKDNDLVLTNVPLTKADITQAKRGFVENTDLFFGRKSHFYMLVRKSALIDVINSIRWRDTRVRATERPVYIDFSMSAIPEEKIKELDLTFRVMKEARDEANALGAEFIVFTVPPKYLVEDDAMKEYIEYFKIDGFAQDPYFVLKNYCRENNIVLVDTLDAFREADRALFFEYDKHWNADGHRVAAIVLESYLNT